VTHEEALIRAFAAPERADRYLILLASPRRRAKFLSVLAHGFQPDMRFARRLLGSDSHTSAIERTLRELGAPAICHCVSDNPKLDGKDLPLAEALAATVGYGMGTLISCLPGELAYYEAEDPAERYILRRAAA